MGVEGRENKDMGNRWDAGKNQKHYISINRIGEEQRMEWEPIGINDKVNKQGIHVN